MPYRTRLDKILERLGHVSKRAAYVVKKHENIRYLCGFDGSFGLLVLCDQGVFLFSDSRYETQARVQAPETEFVLIHGRPWHEVVKASLKEWQIESLLFDKKEWTIDAFEAIKDDAYALSGRVDWVEDLRQIKDPTEIQKLAAAQALAEEALEASLDAFRIGRREREVALDLEWAMRTRGATGLSFPTILASGSRSAMPHGQASDKRLEEGDLLVVDFGCVLDGYCSDMTRTFVMGKADAWSRHLYGLVQTAQDMALAQAQAGITGQAMQALVQDFFDQEGFGAYFGHGLGHAIGLEVHEKPAFSPAGKGPIPAGVVMSVEPGLYIPERGGVRIEDLVVLETGGCQNLNRFPKDLLILDPKA